MKRILVIDDDRASLSLLRELFKSQGWHAETAQTPERALELASREKFDLLLSDINLEAEMSGIDLLRRLRDSCPVVLITGYGGVDTAITAAPEGAGDRGVTEWGEGAWDIVSKPFKLQELIALVRRALESKSPEAEELSESPDAGAGMVGRSPAMLELYKQIARVAPSRSTVLIFG